MRHRYGDVVGDDVMKNVRMIITFNVLSASLNFGLWQESILAGLSMMCALLALILAISEDE